MNKKTFLPSAGEIASVALMIALLVVAQVALGFVAGVEVVTPLLLAYSYVFGAKRGIIAAFGFVLLRQFVWGFYPTVLVLYALYFPLFALFWGSVGRKLKKLWLIAIVATLCSCLFTWIDNVITPLMLSCTWKQTTLYWYASLPVMGLQMLCTAATVSLLFIPLSKTFEKVKKLQQNN